MIRKRAPQPEEVHHSAAVDLGDVLDLGNIVLQAASALRTNRGIVRAKPARELKSQENVVEPRAAFGQPSRQPRVSSERFNSPGRKTSADKASSFTLAQRDTKSWQKAPPDPEKLTPQHAYLRAIALLCGRDYSSKKMAEKLAKLSFASEDIEATLIRLREEGTLSDTRFAASRTNGLINRGKGPRAIQAKLKEAGLAKEMITNALDELEIDWTARARALLNRKFGDTPPGDHKDWAKRARFLIGRGFAEASVRSALKSEKS